MPGNGGVSGLLHVSHTHACVQCSGDRKGLQKFAVRQSHVPQNKWAALSNHFFGENKMLLIDERWNAVLGRLPPDWLTVIASNWSVAFNCLKNSVHTYLKSYSWGLDTVSRNTFEK
jgi:hypothetical protein